MKSENQIIILCKQPIKIETPFRRLLTFPCIAGEKKYSDRFVVIFSVFILSVPFKVIIIVIEFMFLGINMFWAHLRAHFNPRLTARAKMSLSLAQNIFMPANINSIVLVMLRHILLIVAYFTQSLICLRVPRLTLTVVS